MEVSSESISNNVWVGLFQKLFCSYRTGTFLSENDDSVGDLGTFPKLFWCYRGQDCWVPVLEAAFLSALGTACLDSLYPGWDHAVLFLCLIRVLYTLRMEGWKKLLQSFFRKIWIWRKNRPLNYLAQSVARILGVVSPSPPQENILEYFIV